MMDYQLTKIKQRFRTNSLPDVKAELSSELGKIGSLIEPGARIAVAAGSRGVQNLELVVKELVDFIRENHAEPFVVPAMGSHGGATAAGQAEILAGYGISEKSVGAPVRSSMEVIELPRGDCPNRIFMDKYAYDSDGVILINRIKPHTDYHGTYESGLVKMAVIGLGKEKQASAIHRYGIYGLSKLIPKTAHQIFSTGKILGGIALVENAYDDTMLVKVLKGKDIFQQERVLLELARNNMPALPVDKIDLLIIDQMGKDISGVGIDTNIIGRIRIAGQDDPDKPDIKAILVSDLTDNSHGNAIGLGLADVITKKLYDKIDFPATYSNAITSSFLERTKIPIVGANGREAFEIALRSCGYLEKGEENIIRIRDTLHLDEMYVSPSIRKAVNGSERIETMKENVPLFAKGNDFALF